MIEIIQGDASPIFKFQRKNLNGEVIKTKAKNAYFTVKDNFYSKELVFQKRLDDKTITFDEKDSFYKFQIQSEDTEKLPYKKLMFDIAIKNERGEKKTLKKGVLKILEHTTFKENE